MKIALCEDIPIVRTAFRHAVKEYDNNIKVDLFERGQHLLSNFKANSCTYGCLFLDIDLPDINGIEVAKLVRRLDEKLPIVFLTSHEEYMPSVFRIHTFDYLIKPINKKEIAIVLSNVSKFLAKSEKKLEFSYNQTKYSIPLHSILYFEKSARKVKIVTDDKEYFFYSNTESLVNQLTEDFIRTHVSYIVNSQYVAGYSSNFIIIQSEKLRCEIPISRKFRDSSKSKIIEALQGEL